MKNGIKKLIQGTSWQSSGKDLPSHAVDAGLTPGQERKTPGTPGQLSPWATTAEHEHSGAGAPQLEACGCCNEEPRTQAEQQKQFFN